MNIKKVRRKKRSQNINKPQLNINYDLKKTNFVMVIGHQYLSSKIKEQYFVRAIIILYQGFVFGFRSSWHLNFAKRRSVTGK